MPTHETFHKPRPRPAVTPAVAAFVTIGLVGTLALLRYGSLSDAQWEFVPIVLLASILFLVMGTRRFARRDFSRAEPRSLRIDGSILKQFDEDGRQTGEVDLTSHFEYRILGPTNRQNAEFLLFQEDSTLRFFEEDDGALEVIRDALQIPWPRRPRVFLSRTP